MVRMVVMLTSSAGLNILPNKKQKIGGAAALAQPQALKKIHLEKSLDNTFGMNKLPPDYGLSSFGTLDLPPRVRDELMPMNFQRP